MNCVTLGYASMDHFLRVKSFPAMGEKIPFYSYSVMGGGQAATGAVALQRWGAATRYVGRVGGDSTGDQAVEWLEIEGVTVDGALKTTGVTSQTAYIIVPDDCGERTVIWQRQEGLNLKASDLQKKWFQDVSVLFVDGHELDAAVQAAKWVREQNGLVVLDAEHIGSYRHQLLELTDIAVGSEDFGLREFNADSPEKTIEILRSYGVAIAGVTLGVNGSVADWGKGLRYFKALPVDVVDTTGAGDIYHAALAFAALEKYPPEKMFSFASIAASLSCRALGGRSGIPDRDEILKILSECKTMEINNGS